MLDTGTRSRMMMLLTLRFLIITVPMRMLAVAMTMMTRLTMMWMLTFHPCKGPGCSYFSVGNHESAAALVAIRHPRSHIKLINETVVEQLMQHGGPGLAGNRNGFGMPWVAEGHHVSITQ